jgi:hypothetical protein
LRDAGGDDDPFGHAGPGTRQPAGHPTGKELSRRRDQRGTGVLRVTTMLSMWRAPAEAAAASGLSPAATWRGLRSPNRLATEKRPQVVSPGQAGRARETRLAPRE